MGRQRCSWRPRAPDRDATVAHVGPLQPADLADPQARLGREEHRDRSAQALEQAQPPEAVVAPFLWIISAGAPTALLTTVRPTSAPDWPPGIYFLGADILRVGIVVACELPRDTTTLLVRIMAAGPLLRPAVKEVAALPPTSPVRVIAEPVLLQLQHVLGQDPNPDPEEKEFIMAMIKSWEEGRAETRARDVLTVLRVRAIPVPDAVREHILAQKDLERLERWLEKASVATSIGDVIDDPS